MLSVLDYAIDGSLMLHCRLIDGSFLLYLDIVQGGYIEPVVSRYASV